MKIFKYEIKIKEFQEIKVAEQNESLFLWCVVNDEYTDIIKKTVCVFGTGHELPIYIPNYFDTVVMKNGLVWHVYLDN